MTVRYNIVDDATKCRLLGKQGRFELRARTPLSAGAKQHVRIPVNLILDFPANKYAFHVMPLPSFLAVSGLIYVGIDLSKEATLLFHNPNSQRVKIHKGDLLGEGVVLAVSQEEIELDEKLRTDRDEGSTIYD